MPFTITDRAFQKIIYFRAQKEVPDTYGIRIGVKSAGCGVASNTIGFDEKQEGDLVMEKEGQVIFVNKKQLLYLAGKTIDYITNNDSEGFIFLEK